jgi:hypothetical protein
MEAIRTSETLVFFETTRRCIPEDSHFHTRRLTNLKSQIRIVWVIGNRLFIYLWFI